MITHRTFFLFTFALAACSAGAPEGTASTDSQEAQLSAYCPASGSGACSATTLPTSFTIEGRGEYWVTHPYVGSDRKCHANGASVPENCKIEVSASGATITLSSRGEATRTLTLSGSGAASVDNTHKIFATAGDSYIGLTCPKLGDAYSATLVGNTLYVSISVSNEHAGGEVLGFRCDGSVTFASPPAPVSDVPGAGDLVITEFMANPRACSDSTGEWIEVYNASQRTLSLKGLALQTKADVANVTTDASLAPGKYAVFGRGTASTFCGAFVPSGYYQSKLSLNNDGDDLSLHLGANLIDRAASYTKAAAADGKSWRLVGAQSATANDSLTAWSVSTTLLGASEYGTPGSY